MKNQLSYISKANPPSIRLFYKLSSSSHSTNVAYVRIFLNAFTHQLTKLARQGCVCNGIETYEGFNCTCITNLHCASGTNRTIRTSLLNKWFFKLKNTVCLLIHAYYSIIYIVDKIYLNNLKYHLFYYGVLVIVVSQWGFVSHIFIL